MVATPYISSIHNRSTRSNIIIISNIINIIGLLDLIFETIYEYTYHTSYRLDVNDQLNFKRQKSETPSLLTFEINCLIPSNVILKFSS